MNWTQRHTKAIYQGVPSDGADSGAGDQLPMKSPGNSWDLMGFNGI